MIHSGNYLVVEIAVRPVVHTIHS